MHLLGHQSRNPKPHQCQTKCEWQDLKCEDGKIRNALLGQAKIISSWRLQRGNIRERFKKDKLFNFFFISPSLGKPAVAQCCSDLIIMISMIYVATVVFDIKLINKIYMLVSP